MSAKLLSCVDIASIIKPDKSSEESAVNVQLSSVLVSRIIMNHMKY